MAARGVRPKPAHLTLIDGTRHVTRHGSEDDLRKKAEGSAQAFGKLQRPRHLKGEGLAAWKNYIEPAAWLDRSREPAALAFCELWHEFRRAPVAFASSKHAQMRAYMGELGLTDERNRILKKSEEKDEFFND